MMIRVRLGLVLFWLMPWLLTARTVSSPLAIPAPNIPTLVERPSALPRPIPVQHEETPVAPVGLLAEPAPTVSSGVRFRPLVPPLQMPLSPRHQSRVQRGIALTDAT